MTDALQPFAAWEAWLTKQGYKAAKTAANGAKLFTGEGKPSYRLASFSPNEATSLWLARTGTQDARCDINPDHIGYVNTPASDLPEFGPTEPQYRIVDCLQQSEEWDRWRARPTASQFGRIVSPTRGDYSEQATAYAAEIVAKRLGVYTEPPPSFWMTWGTESEPLALASYEEANGVDVRKVGFMLPLYTDAYGGSPDGLVGNDGLIEIKCPKPETLIRWHAAGVLPDEHRPQIQGLLLISRLPWCDFYAWHPGLTPFQIRVRADEGYQTKIANAIYKLLEEVERIESSVSRNPDYVAMNGNEEAEIIITGDIE